jgi:hypothetical protein
MDKQAALPTQGNQVTLREGTQGRTKMKPLFGIFPFLLCASFIIFAPPSPALAQSRGADACMALAAKITLGTPRKLASGASSIFQQISRDRVYFKCLQSRGQHAAPRASATAIAGTFTTFDPPGSTVTNPVGITPAGAIAGYYFDASDLSHSFLRAPGGTLTPFDPPGATCSVSTQNTCSVVSGINPAGVITGYYTDANFVNHGFLRDRSGAITAFDPPGVCPRPLR